MSGADQAARFAEAAAAFRAAHPQIEAVEAVVTDLNGVQRGKLLPIDALEKLGSGGVRLPISTAALDVFSADVEAAGLALEIGDPDGVLLPAPETLSPMAWAARPTAQVICAVSGPDWATPADLDARGVAMRQAQRAAAQGLTPCAALELEFYLVDRDRTAAGQPQPPTPPAGGERLARAQLYDLATQRAFDPILSAIADAAALSGAPIEGAIAEFGPGQFEITLPHREDPVAAADALVLLKRAIRGVSRAQGCDATFMPKPYGDQAGSGLHLHMSLRNADGRNVFDGGPDATGPNDALRAAVGGLRDAMPGGALIWAPHANSYRRLAPGSYAPIVAAWGLDNRGVALRCPAIRGPAARFEHRVSGADANPYLVMAHVLAGALDGLDRRPDPGAPITGEAGPGDGPPLPLSWLEAIAAWENDALALSAHGSELRRIFALIKRQEYGTLLTRISDAEIEAYLRTV